MVAVPRHLLASLLWLSSAHDICAISSMHKIVILYKRLPERDGLKHQILNISGKSVLNILDNVTNVLSSSAEFNSLTVNISKNNYKIFSN